MNLQRVGAVLQVIGHAGHGSGQFARLAHRHKTGVQPVGQGRPKDESPRLNGQHEVDLELDVMRRQRIDQLGKAGPVLEQRRDVVEQNPRLGKIGHRAHQRLQGFHIDGLDFFWHTSVHS